jgi:hypothetical protein
MQEILNSRNLEMLIPILAIVGGCLIAIIAIVSHHWAKVRQTEMEAALKQEMLRQGLSASDIERVISATVVNKEEAEEKAKVSRSAS